MQFKDQDQQAWYIGMMRGRGMPSDMTPDRLIAIMQKNDLFGEEPVPTELEEIFSILDAWAMRIQSQSRAMRELKTGMDESAFDALKSKAAIKPKDLDSASDILDAEASCNQKSDEAHRNKLRGVTQIKSDLKDADIDKFKAAVDRWQRDPSSSKINVLRTEAECRRPTNKELLDEAAAPVFPEKTALDFDPELMMSSVGYPEMHVGADGKFILDELTFLKIQLANTERELFAAKVAEPAMKQMQKVKAEEQRHAELMAGIMTSIKERLGLAGKPFDVQLLDLQTRVCKLV